MYVYEIKFNQCTHHDHYQRHHYRSSPTVYCSRTLPIPVYKRRDTTHPPSCTGRVRNIHSRIRLQETRSILTNYISQTPCRAKSAQDARNNEVVFDIAPKLDNFRDIGKVYLRRVQWRPFHPCEQTHVPLRHWPCSWHRGSHGSCSQRGPVQPGSQRHLPVSQMPCWPQSRLHNAGNERIDCVKRVYAEDVMSVARYVQNVMFNTTLETCACSLLVITSRTYRKQSAFLCTLGSQRSYKIDSVIAQNA